MLTHVPPKRLINTRAVGERCVVGPRAGRVLRADP